jgi:hypothetical protein
MNRLGDLLDNAELADEEAGRSQRDSSELPSSTLGAGGAFEGASLLTPRPVDTDLGSANTSRVLGLVAPCRRVRGFEGDS